MASGIEGLVRFATRLLFRGLLQPLYRNLWQAPADARGALWTLSLWLRLLAGAFLLAKLPTAALLFAAGWGLSRWQGMKPKKHARPLPYRRHR